MPSLPQPLKHGKTGCWLDLACGLWLAGSSFSIHDFKGSMCVYGKGYREVEGQVTPHKPPFLPPPSSRSSPPLRAQNTSPAALALTSK